MKFAATLLVILGSAQAFTPAFNTRPVTFLSSHIDKGFTADSGMTVDNLPLYIDNLNKENFMESLEMFEALLANECVGDSCADYVSQLADKASSIGMKLPKGFGSKHH